MGGKKVKLQTPPLFREPMDLGVGSTLVQCLNKWNVLCRQQWNDTLASAHFLHIAYMEGETEHGARTEQYIRVHACVGDAGRAWRVSTWPGVTCRRLTPLIDADVPTGEA